MAMKLSNILRLTKSGEGFKVKEEPSLSAKKQQIAKILEEDPNQLFEVNGKMLIDHLDFNNSDDMDVLAFLFQQLLKQLNLKSNPKIRLIQEKVRTEERIQVEKQNLLKTFAMLLANKISTISFLKKKQKLAKDSHTSIITGTTPVLKGLDKNMLLIEAVQKKNLPQIKEILDSAPNLLFIEYASRSLLMLAAELGDSDVVELLLSYDTDKELIYNENSLGYNAAWVATMHGHSKCLGLLLAHDVEKRLLMHIDVETLNLAHIAALQHQYEILGVLLQANDPDYVFLYNINDFGATLVHSALSVGAYNLAFQLMKHYPGAFPETHQGTFSKLMFLVSSPSTGENAPLITALLKMMIVNFKEFEDETFYKRLLDYRKMKDHEMIKAGKLKGTVTVHPAFNKEIFSECYKLLVSFVKSGDESIINQFNQRLQEIQMHQKRIEISIKTVQEKLKAADEEISMLEASLKSDSTKSDTSQVLTFSTSSKPMEMEEDREQDRKEHGEKRGREQAGLSLDPETGTRSPKRARNE